MWFLKFTRFLRIVFFLVVGSILIAEGILRVPSLERKLVDPLDASKEGCNPWLPDPDYIFKMRSNLDGYRLRGEGWPEYHSFNFSTNTLGLRSPEIKADKTGPRVLILGDSCSFGYGLADNETYPAILQGVLASDGAKSKPEVINAAVPGYTSWQCLRFLEVEGLRLHPDIVVMGCGFNDSSARWGCSDMKKAEETHPWPCSRILYHSRLGRLFFMLRLDDNQLEEDEWLYRPRLTIEESKAVILSLYQVCKEERIRLILTVWPLRAQVCNENQEGLEGKMTAELVAHILQYLEYQEEVRALARDHGVSLIDGAALFKTGDPCSLFVDIIHPSFKGTSIMAKAVANKIQSLQ